MVVLSMNISKELNTKDSIFSLSILIHVASMPLNFSIVRGGQICSAASRH